MITGYLHPGYAESLSEFGAPRLLSSSGGWILKRAIPGVSDADAMGCYPLFACEDWSRLPDDLEELRGELVSLSMVTDPFGEYTADDLHECFREVVFPFKDHFIVDLSSKPQSSVSSHHQRNAGISLRSLNIEKCDVPIQFLDEWCKLYDTLVERHAIRGLLAFSRSSFARQLSVPGLVAFRATHQGAAVGMILWYVQGNVSYYHLGAYNSLGYEMRAAFGLFWYALEYFSSQGLAWLNLGAGAGLKSNGDGLTRFKSGWATGARTAYFCGRIFDPERYAEILALRNIQVSDYFPAYRQGEFA
jgi:Acetyltransferase (GNAT) domain